jgi:pyridoxamine 5'-phosphate oxidase
MADNDFLPEPLPGNPLPLLASWFREARTRALQPNPDAMVLATVGSDGAPSARVVLCKRLDDAAGYAVFYTNERSRKGRELAHEPRAAAVMHWDALRRQVRLEGQVLRSPTAESDEYFASRAVLSRLSAWASQQSEPLESRATLTSRIEEAATRFGVPVDATDGQVPRPAHWGGYRLWLTSIELWVEAAGRSHDRAVWTRSLARKDEFSFAISPWTATRLNP